MRPFNFCIKCTIFIFTTPNLYYDVSDGQIDQSQGGILVKSITVKCVTCHSRARSTVLSTVLRTTMLSLQSKQFVNLMSPINSLTSVSCYCHIDVIHLFSTFYTFFTLLKYTDRLQIILVWIYIELDFFKKFRVYYLQITYNFPLAAINFFGGSDRLAEFLFRWLRLGKSAVLGGSLIRQLTGLPQT